MLRLICSMDSNKAYGRDANSIAMLKIWDVCLVEPFYLTFKECLETGVYPSRWKRGNIIFVHKKGSRQNEKNYRLISTLSICGEILEAVIFDEIYQHPCNNLTLNPHKSGFHLMDSTINQLFCLKQLIGFGIMGYFPNLKCPEFLDWSLFFWVVFFPVADSISYLMVKVWNGRWLPQVFLKVQFSVLSFFLFS